MKSCDKPDTQLPSVQIVGGYVYAKPHEEPTSQEHDLRSMLRKKLQPIKAFKKHAWETISRFVRNRDPYCVTCLMEGKQTPTSEAGHYRHNSERKADLGGNALWYDLRNLNGQCSRCNRYLSGNLDKYGLYLETKYGFGILQELNVLYQTPKKWSREEVSNFLATLMRATLTDLSIKAMKPDEGPCFRRKAGEKGEIADRSPFHTKPFRSPQ